MAVCRVCGMEGTDEVWRSFATPAALDACSHCLAIQWRDPSKGVEIDGAIVLRTRDRLQDLSESDLRAEVERLAADETLFVLLRVPAIFEHARGLIGDKVRLARPAEHGITPSPDTEAMRELLRRAVEATPEERRRFLEDVRVRRPSGGPPEPLERYERIRFEPRVGPRIDDPAGARAVLGRGETFRVTGLERARVVVERADRFGTRAYLAPLDLLEPG